CGPMGSGIHGQLQRRVKEGIGCDIAGARGAAALGGMTRASTPRIVSAAGDPSSASCTVMPAPTAACKQGSSGMAPTISTSRLRKCAQAPVRNSQASCATDSPLRLAITEIAAPGLYELTDFTSA